VLKTVVQDFDLGTAPHHPQLTITRWRGIFEVAVRLWNEMMTLEQAINTLARHKDALIEFKVDSLFVFGSVARGEAGPRSDIDILVEFSETVGLFEFARLRGFLEDVLGCRVDLVTPGALRESMRENVLREAVRAA
jgi:predicted nucleotidyltransferase